MYFDNAASTPVDNTILQEFLENSQKFYANPASVHSLGNSAKLEILKATKHISNLLNLDFGKLIFTSGTTESNNLAIFGQIELIRNKTVVCFDLEHDSVIKPLQELQNQGIIDLKFCPANTLGEIDLGVLENMLASDSAAMLCLMSAQNEIGTIQPITEVSLLLSKINSNRQINNLPKILWHLDAAQSIQFFDIEAVKLGVTSMSFGSSKIYAPKGIGLLYIENLENFKPRILGGGQQKNLRSGTVSAPMIMAFTKALVLVYKNREKILPEFINFKQKIIQALEKSSLEFELNNAIFKKNNSTTSFTSGIYTDLNNQTKSKAFEFNLSKEKLNTQNLASLPNNLSIFLPNKIPDEVLTFIDLQGIMLSSGSGCHSGSLVPSVIREKLGLNNNGTTLRISFGRFNKQKEIDYLIKTLISLKNI